MFWYWLIETDELFLNPQHNGDSKDDKSADENIKEKKFKCKMC